MANQEQEPIERIILKLPKSVAAYFRHEFPHGQRSQFVADCILSHKREQEISVIEEELRKVNKYRQ